MNCKKCNALIDNNSKFCPKCGNAIEFDGNNMNTNMNTNMNNNYSSTNANDNKDKMGIASLVIGIISLIFAYFLNIIILPVAIVGLILGIINKKKSSKKTAGIILNAISILIIVVMIVISVLVLKSSGIFDELLNIKNPVNGEYVCSYMYDDSNKITLNLNKDGTFSYGPYGNMEKNYVIGNYTYSDLNKTNGSGEYKYYLLDLEGDKEDFVVDGVPNENDFSAKMEFGITTKDGKRNGIIMFYSTYNIYYCYEN